MEFEFLATPTVSIVYARVLTFLFIQKECNNLHLTVANDILQKLEQCVHFYPSIFLYPFIYLFFNYIKIKNINLDL